MSYTYKDERNELIKAGDYEVVIEKIEERVLQSGKEKLSIQYRVRSDVEQEYKNKCIFEDIWKEKLSPEHYNRKRINRLLGTQNFKDGTLFEGINDVKKALIGKYLIVHIEIELDDYTNENKEVVAYYKETKNATKTLDDGLVKKNTEKIEIKDDDLPF